MKLVTNESIKHWDSFLNALVNLKLSPESTKQKKRKLKFILKSFYNKLIIQLDS